MFDSGGLGFQRNGLQGCADLDTALDRARHRAEALMDLMRPFSDLLLVIRQLQSICDMNAANHQYLIIELDLASGV